MAKKETFKPPREMTHRQLSAHKRAVRRQRFIFFGGIAVIVAVVVIIFSGWLAGSYFPMHETVLQVYDAKFSVQYFEDDLVLVMQAYQQDVSNISSIAYSLTSMIVQDEVVRQGAKGLGYTVSDNVIKTYLKDVGFKDTAVTRDFAISQVLPGILKDDYFSKQVPTSDNMVYLTALMCEDEAHALELRQKLLAGDNITALAADYGLGDYTGTNKGDFGLHPQSVFVSDGIPNVPVNYAFGDGMQAGSISAPLSDNVSTKKTGYWLIRVDSRTDTSANVTAVLCTDNNTANMLRPQLMTTDNVADLAVKYNQYSAHLNGQMGTILAADNVSGSTTFIAQAFHDYVFSPDTEVGVWSGSLRDTTSSTKGGWWVVKVDDVQLNAELTDTDRSKLIDDAYSTWSSKLVTEATPNIGNYFTDKSFAKVIADATKKLGG